uniref:Uncharacterized protein n=1 Tax=Setaria italica TaxID=4555 RepID=K3YZW0_SETIT
MSAETSAMTSAAVPAWTTATASVSSAPTSRRRRRILSRNVQRASYARCMVLYRAIEIKITLWTVGMERPIDASHRGEIRKRFTYTKN